VGKKEYKDVQNEVRGFAVNAQALKDELLRAVDLDTAAFNKLMEAFRLKKKTLEQKKERERTIEEATKEATLIPHTVLKMSVEAVELAKKVALKGNKNSLSDAGVAGLAAQTAAEGAYYNIKINLPNIQDEKFKLKINREAVALRKKAVKIGTEIRNLMEKELK